MNHIPELWPPSDRTCPEALQAGRRLAHDRDGGSTGTPVLFLHGITGSRHYWGPARARLGRGRPLLLPDLLGFGASPKPARSHDLRRHVSAVRGFLEEAGLSERPFDVVAHSLGALIALEYVLRWPGQVRRAALIGLPVHRDRDEAHRYFLAGSPNYRRLVGGYGLRHDLRSWTSAGPSMALRYLFAFNPRIASDSKSWTLRSLTSTIEHCLLEHRVQERVGALAGLPAARRPGLLLLHGDRDQVTPLHRVRELSPLLPGARLEVLRGTGHHPFRTHPRRCLDLIEGFLRERDPEPRA